MSAIESHLTESRSFPPPQAFRDGARISDDAEYARLHAESLRDPAAFWTPIARELPWSKPFTQVLDWSGAPVARWFGDGELNASEVCVDRHLDTARRDKVALHWEGEPGDRRSLTYGELSIEVNRLANALKARGVKRGDRVALYMPLVPELAVALLACARIGAAHSVVFGGFSAASLRERIQDGDCTAVITADGGWRKGQVLPLKATVDEALVGIQSVHTVLVLRRAGNDVAWQAGRDLWYRAFVDGQSDVCAPESMGAEDVLFLLYTSGSTGKPKGIVHTTGGYLVAAYHSTRTLFDLKDSDVYWCTADIGWVTGHTYVVYGPLANGATVVLYEGAPNAPDEGRFWRIVEHFGVTIFYTAPTAIRTFMRWGDQWPASADLSSLRLLGTVGEPINPEAWMWYREHIGRGRCPIVDTWWQTETGSAMIAPLPGVHATVPGSAMRPFFGVDAAIVDERGVEVGPNQGGFLVLRKPWPSMLRGLWGDPQRYQAAYWARYPGMYFAGDGARRDALGNFWILGRVDDVLNVSGHRLSTMEVESALVSHPAVVEAAVVARPDEVTGEAIVAFVSLAPDHNESESLATALKAHVVKEIGALARPAEIRFAPALPKTRSGKIMRRLLRDVAAGRETTGDTSTIEDLFVLAQLRAEEE